MTLEVLFAQQGQAETFLRMVLLGAAFAGGVRPAQMRSSGWV